MEGEGKTTLQAVSMGSCGWVAKCLMYFWLFWHHQTSSSQLGDSNLVILGHVRPTAHYRTPHC